jgi:hypothetical protein
MTRTHITAADGTRFVQVGQGARIARRILGGVALLATALLLSAAVIGLNRAAIAPATPSPADIAILHNAEKANGKGACHLEWNETQSGFEVICNTNPEPSASTAIKLTTARKACRAAGVRGMQDCLALYMRNAWSSADTYTPAGPALVKECISQYRGAELRDCFTQEIG